jgi:hypothetical protein
MIDATNENRVSTGIGMSESIYIGCCCGGYWTSKPIIRRGSQVDGEAKGIIRECSNINMEADGNNPVLLTGVYLPSTRSVTRVFALLRDGLKSNSATVCTFTRRL